MIVAIKCGQMGLTSIRLETLLGFDEFEYLALFLWLAIAGAGAVSLDHLLMRTRRTVKTEAPRAPASAIMGATPRRLSTVVVQRFCKP